MLLLKVVLKTTSRRPRGAPCTAPPPLGKVRYTTSVREACTHTLRAGPSEVHPRGDHNEIEESGFRHIALRRTGCGRCLCTNMDVGLHIIHRDGRLFGAARSPERYHPVPNPAHHQPHVVHQPATGAHHQAGVLAEPSNPQGRHLRGGTGQFVHELTIAGAHPLLQRQRDAVSHPDGHRRVPAGLHQLLRSRCVGACGQSADVS